MIVLCFKITFMFTKDATTESILNKTLEKIVLKL